MTILPTDTLAADTATMASWRSDGRFDYSSELLQGDFSLWEWLQYQFNTWMGKLFAWVEPSESNKWIWLLVAIVIAVGIAYLIIIRRPSVFGRRADTAPIDYQVIEDNIYGIDFDSMIARALSRTDYAGAVRLVYLQTLRRLSDEGRIKWRKSKAPMQYAREEGSSDMRQLVMLFVYVRYGGKICDRQQVDQAVVCQRAILSNIHTAEGRA